MKLQLASQLKIANTSHKKRSHSVAQEVGSQASDKSTLCALKISTTPRKDATQRDQVSSTIRYQTPKLMRALGKEDPVETRRKAEGFKVFVEAFESYCDDGFTGPDLQRKAVSQYTNWAAQEWNKPHEFSTD